jgi:hypothetical protein
MNRYGIPHKVETAAKATQARALTGEMVRGREMVLGGEMGRGGEMVLGGESVPGRPCRKVQTQRSLQIA